MRPYLSGIATDRYLE